MAKRKADTKSAMTTSPLRFINRELSWLAFNQRVLDEANNHTHPLLERLRFLSISASNLDEFDMVRYAGLREQVRAGLTKPSQDGRTPAEQVAEIAEVSNQLIKKQEIAWKSIRAEMKKENISVLDKDELSKDDRKWLGKYFEDRLYPIITPLAIDPSHPFPFLPNLGFAIAVRLRSDNGNETMTGLVPLPSFSPRFIRLPKNKKELIRFISIEDIIGLHIPLLYPGFSEVDHCLMRIIRDSDIEIEEEAEDLIRELEILLKQRRRGRIVRIRMEASAPESLRKYVLREIGAEAQDMVLCDGLLGLSHLKELITDERPDLQYTPYEPRYPERIREMGGDCFAAIRAKDILVHHPFESFDVVVQFLQQAAADPDVAAIKQTLYRTTHDSPIVAALIEAAGAGKNVTALVEIKARFDEEANLRLARDLERAGVQVVYGFIDYKTHAKVSLVVRREDDELRTYTHFGTGNYHPINARIYTDLSLFTADAALGRDASRLFNFVTAYREPPDLGPQMEKISMSPLHMEQTLIELIEAEAENALKGKPSGIWAKMNSLADGDVIDALYKASQAGVPIHLVVRGICCLRPGVKGMSETITVKSIVGRFLEHARIICFANGKQLPSARAKVFLSSADWMPRNLKRRVEVMVPIETPTVHRQILNQIMVANLNDEAQTWIMQDDGTYKRLRPEAGGDTFCAHQYFMDNPSLSGRGSALQVNLPPRLAPGEFSSG